MTAIETLKRVLQCLRDGDTPDIADLEELEQAVVAFEQDRSKSRAFGRVVKPRGRPVGATRKDDSGNNAIEQARIERVMGFMELLAAGTSVGEASQEMAAGSRTLDRDRKKFGGLARFFLEDDAAFEAVLNEMKREAARSQKRRPAKLSASKDFGLR